VSWRVNFGGPACVLSGKDGEFTMSRFAMFVLMVPFVMALAAMVPLVAIAQTPRSAGVARPMDGRLERLS
jgi:hypothetical protein